MYVQFTGTGGPPDVLLNKFASIGNNSTTWWSDPITIAVTAGNEYTIRIYNGAASATTLTDDPNPTTTLLFVY